MNARTNVLRPSDSEGRLEEQTSTERRRRVGLSLLSNALTFAGAATAAACGSPSSAASGGTLDCSWAKSDNCWKSTVATAKGCLPPSTQGAPRGKLSADLTTCTYATGQTIAFARPVKVLAPMRLVLPNFALTSGGALCLQYEGSGSSSSVVTTPSGAYAASQDSGGKNVTLTCPDGAKWSGTTSSLDLCDNEAPAISVLPSGSVSDAGVFTGSVAVDFGGTSDGTTRVFDCETP
jgi:hypothetical protein